MNDNNSRPTWVRVVALFLRDPLRLGLTMLMVLSSAAAGVVSPFLLRAIIDEAIPRRDVRLLTLLCLGMLAIGVFQNAMFLWNGMLTNAIGLKAIHSLRVAIYDRIQSMPITFHSGESGSEVQARLASDIGGVSDVITFSAQSALWAVTTLLTVGVAMTLMSWPVALVSLGLCVGLAFVSRRFAKRRQVLAKATQDATASMLKYAAEDLSLNGVILGRTLRRASWQRERFAAASQDIADSVYRQRLAGRISGAITGVTLAAIPPVVYWMAGGGAQIFSIGTAVILVVLQSRLSAPITQLLGLNSEFSTSLVMFRRIFEYMDLPRPELIVSESAEDRSALPTLEIRGASYRYPATNRLVLDQLNLSVRAGTTTVLTGLSGCGKSTLGLLITGLVEPDSGSIAIGSSKANRVSSATLVAQDPFLFNASIRENLLFANPDASDVEIYAVLSCVALRTLIDELPEGLETSVGEGGHQLSGGERQRLALARAMLSDCRVLVVDEITSALDAPTAATVQRSVREYCAGRRTLLIITHRLSALDDGDAVALMENGRIIAQGAHGDLVLNNPAYAHLLRLDTAVSEPDNKVVA